MSDTFSFFNSVVDSFSTAVSLAKKATEVYTELSKDDDDDTDSFVRKRLYNFDSTLRSARPGLQTMDQPRGVAAPNMTAAFSYFRDNVARDKNIHQISQTSYVPKRTAKIATTTPTVTMADAKVNYGGKTTFQTSGVMKL